jgi:hypothetical protein
MAWSLGPGSCHHRLSNSRIERSSALNMQMRVFLHPVFAEDLRARPQTRFVHTLKRSVVRDTRRAPSGTTVGPLREGSFAPGFINDSPATMMV